MYAIFLHYNIKVNTQDTADEHTEEKGDFSQHVFISNTMLLDLTQSCRQMALEPCNKDFIKYPHRERYTAELNSHG